LLQRKVKKTINTYLMALPDYDNKMKTTFFICLETGRSNSGQQDPPIRPYIEIVDRDGKKKQKSMGLAFQTITKHGDIGSDIRSQYVPAPGYIFVQADSSQAEARVVFLLADDEDALRDIDAHDYHALTASWFFTGKESDYSKKVLGYESPIRFAGKTLRHAGHLGAGARRAATELNTQVLKYGIKFPDGKPFPPLSEAFCKGALDTFHKKQPKIRNVFHAEVIKCLEKTRTLIHPVPYGFDIEHGSRRTFYERWGDELFRQALSDIPQRAVSENTKGAGLRIRKRIPGIRILGESHDALVFMIKEDDFYKQAPIIKEEFEMPINFSNCSIPRRNLTIPCDIEVSYNYQDFKKFSVIAMG
jgi:DNA polymerase family A